MDASKQRLQHGRRKVPVPCLLAYRLLLAVVWLALLNPPATAEPLHRAPLLSIEGPVGPATAAYVERGLASAADQRAPFVLLLIDTPGGLDTSMREIIRAILASPVPVVGYVAPPGARAASAGTYILYATHVAAMAPGTNLGAATPIRIGTPGDGKSPEGDKGDHPAASEAKAVNDAAAYMRGLAELRHRNVDWAERAVREAASLPAEEALKAKVIDLTADDVPALVRALNGREVAMPSGTVVLHTAGVVVSPIEPDWRTRTLAVITNPNVATILILIGIYGIIFEFYTPGFYGPGVIGAICLLLGLYALHLLPVDYTGVALLLLGIALMVAEVFTPGFGALGLGGIAAFAFGSTMLLDRDVPGFEVAWPLVGGIAIGMGGVMLAIVALAARARRRPALTGANELIGALGPVVDWQGLNGRVRIRGILWQATADRSLAMGEQIRVTGVNGLTLDVERWDERS
jgi:Membrane-bound serine protease (ClpP class)